MTFSISLEAAMPLDDDLGRQAAEALNSALGAHELDGHPTPTSDKGRIALGEIPVTSADRLADVLGAEPAPERTELPDWPEGHRIVLRLRTALASAIGHEFVDVAFVPYCPRCDEDPVLTLGSLSLTAARRLTQALSEASAANDPEVCSVVVPSDRLRRLP